MWNTGFPLASLFLYMPYPCISQHQLPLLHTFSSTSITPKQLETIDALPQNSPDSTDPAIKKCSKSVKGPQGRGRRLSTKEKFRRKRLRQDKFQRKKQKKDRNIPSNIIKNFFQFLVRHPNLIQFLKNSKPPQASVDLYGFALKLKRVIETQKSYIKTSVLQSLWKQEGLERDEGLLFRIILKKFLVIMEPMILASRDRFKKSQKLEYMKCCRKMWSQFENTQNN